MIQILLIAEEYGQINVISYVHKSCIYNTSIATKKHEKTT